MQTSPPRSPSPAARRFAVLTVACCLPLLAGAKSVTIGLTTLTVSAPGDGEKLKNDRDIVVRGSVDYPMDMGGGSAYIWSEFEYGDQGVPFQDEQGTWNNATPGIIGSIVTAAFTHTYTAPKDDYPAGGHGGVGVIYDGNAGGSTVFLTVGFTWDINP